MTSLDSETKVSCVLLTLNEEGAIEKVVNDIRQILPRAEIVVVDSSTDRTADIAEAMGCTVVRQLPPKGYGWAMDAGLKKASGEYVITLDCDDTYPTEVLKELVKRMDAGADLVSCSRMERKPEAMKYSHFVANRIFALTARLLCGAKTTDVHTGMRAYRKQMLQEISFDPEGMALPVELQIGPQRLGYHCQEFFIDYRPRIGASKIVPIEGSIWTFRRIWRWRRFFNSKKMQSTMVAVLALLMFPLAALSKERTVVCRHFVQKNPIVGEMEVKFTPTAATVFMKRGGWTQLLYAPHWKNILINKEAKTFCRRQKDTWWDRAIGVGVQTSATRPVKSVGTKKEKVLWMDTTRVTLKGLNSSLGVGLNQSDDIDCYYFRDPKIPAPVCKHMARQSAVPDLGGLIVRMKNSGMEGPGAIKMDTIKADTLEVPASEFEIPKGFKEVFSPQEIMLGTGADVLKDFLP